MPKTARKDLIRLIGNSKGRFLTLLLIVALGVSFYVGVSATSPIMAYSVGEYQKETDLKDITVYANYGFDEEDVTAIKALPAVKNAEGTKFVDVLAKTEREVSIARVHAYSPQQQINHFALREGRLPENNREALAEAGNSIMQRFVVGDTVTLSRPENDLEDWLDNDTFTVVGLIDTPLYLNETKENSTLSNRYLETYLYVKDEVFTIDYMTEINVVLKEADAYPAFSDQYVDYGKEVAKEIEGLATSQATHRREEILKEALEEYEDGLKEYEDGKKEFDEEILDAEKKITDAEQEILDGENEIAQAKKDLVEAKEKLDREYINGQDEINRARKEITEGYEKLKEKEKELEEGLARIPEINAGIAQIEEGTKQLEEGIAQLQQAKQGLIELNEGITKLQELQANLNAIQESLKDFPAETPIAILVEQNEALKVLIEQMQWQSLQTLQELRFAIQETITNSQAQEAQLQAIKQGILDSLKEKGIDESNLDQNIASYQAQKEQLLAEKQELENTLLQLEDGKKQIAEANEQIKKANEQTVNASVQLDEAIAEAQKEIDDGWKEVAENEQKLLDAREDVKKAKEELEDARIEGQKELDDAKADLTKAKQDIDELEAGEWTVLDRTKHYGSETYRETIHQMEAIAAIFPVFFFLVAALVCLTTMTRMVDEQRGQIGIYRALGYSQLQCAKKYLYYAGIATLFGEFIGVILGLLIFPPVIYHTWRMLYILPSYRVIIPWRLIIVSSILFLAIMLMTTWSACASDMKDVPSQLLRPKAPKIGKKIFLEKIGFLWNAFSFSWKVTIRNLIRYKKRFIMTVIGVAGCCALLVTGFGIRDSITALVHLQFEEILKYDGIVTFKKDLSEKEKQNAITSISQMEEYGDGNYFAMYSGIARKEDEKDESVNMMIFDDNKEIEPFITLRTINGHRPLQLDDSGLIISQRLSENMGLKVGDSLKIESNNGIIREARISGICEMYIYHYAFLTQTYYESLFGTKLTKTDYLIRVNENVIDQEGFQKTLAEMESVQAISYYDTAINNFQNMVKGLNLIVWVLLISSMSLAFVVLGNLTNVNISERQREIATLKVLGFRKIEVQDYIFKENNILTILGALLGIPLGILLHHYIMRTVEMDYIIFGRRIHLLSLGYSVILTILFGFMVNFFLRKRLQRIEMVESLKSVE
ncbi:MAG: ABC transporter permease [Solobacterium sp.]|nr:ABC transporter permease [Solobacterium sp.]